MNFPPKTSNRSMKKNLQLPRPARLTASWGWSRNTEKDPLGFQTHTKHKVAGPFPKEFEACGALMSLQQELRQLNPNLAELLIRFIQSQL